MSHADPDLVRQHVREAYGAVARQADAAPARAGGCCTPAAAPSCCAPSAATSAAQLAQALGYGDAETTDVPVGANLGLGCGNPQAIAALRPGERVLDLGSGAGFDCFLAARAVGPGGQVIGVDMTPDMLTQARALAARGGYAQVEFRLGEIEHLPVADASVDVILSNCVINLSPDKPQVFREAFRVLRPGGRLALADIVAMVPLPPDMRADLALHTACVAGAASVEDLTGWLLAAGFHEVRIQAKDASGDYIRQWAPGRGVERYIASASIEAIKPAA